MFQELKKEFLEFVRFLIVSFKPIQAGDNLVASHEDILKKSSNLRKNINTSRKYNVLMRVRYVDGPKTDVFVRTQIVPEKFGVKTENFGIHTISTMQLMEDYIAGKVKRISDTKMQEFFVGNEIKP